MNHLALGIQDLLKFLLQPTDYEISYQLSAQFSEDSLDFHDQHPIIMKETSHLNQLHLLFLHFLLYQRIFLKYFEMHFHFVFNY